MKRTAVHGAYRPSRRAPPGAERAARRECVEDEDMVEISDADFEALVEEVYDDLPEDMVGPLENVVILIEDQAPGSRPRLFGQYSGHPLTGRGVYGFGELPDRITLYRNNLAARSDDLEGLRAQVRITLVHEIGHYFGLDDARLRELGWA